MKMQWSLILSILFAIIIAVFAILNIESVKVNYLFGEAHLPLILVILFTALLGAAISGFIAMFRAIHANRHINELKKEMTAKEITIATQQNEIAALQHLVEPAINKDKVEGET
ncbi:LapA family protein [Sporosarcina koreensis]|uniref:LapA family protein n=1 Tax=Sporosarcina koreensis TaxID=334735 RepID=UPI000754602D|nr:lipopolysaccharide assembly protein LapA domain-containing protein [Sporosarcina koreensis]